LAKARNTNGANSLLIKHLILTTRIKTIKDGFTNFVSFLRIHKPSRGCYKALLRMRGLDVIKYTNTLKNKDVSMIDVKNQTY